MTTTPTTGSPRHSRKRPKQEGTNLSDDGKLVIILIFLACKKFLK